MSDDQIQIPFAGGPNETLDARHLPPGSVASAANQVYDLDGSYQPRFGYTRLGGEPATLQRLATSVRELLAVSAASFTSSFASVGGAGQATLSTYDTGGDNFVPKDVLPTPGVTHAPLVNTSTNFQSWDIADGNGYRVVAWIDADLIARVSAYDQVTGAEVMSPTALGGGNTYTAIRAGYCATGVAGNPTVYIVAARLGVTPQQIEGWYLPVSTGTPTPSGFVPAATGAGTVLASAATHSAGNPGIFGFDCAPASTPPVTLTYEVVVGTASALRIQSFSATLAAVSSVDTLTGGSPVEIVTLAHRTDPAGAGWVSFVMNPASGGNNVFIGTFNSATLAVTGGGFTPLVAATAYPSTGNLPRRIVLERISATACVWILDGMNGGSGGFWIAYGTFNTALTLVSGSTQWLRNLTVSSWPVFVPQLNTALVMLRYPNNNPNASTVQSTNFLVDLSTSTIGTTGSHPILVSVLAPQISTVVDPTVTATLQYVAPRLVAGSATTFETVMPLARSGIRTGLDLFIVDFAAPYRWTPAFVGREKYLSGAIYDGTRVFENGFAWPPFVTAASSSGSGAFTGTWTYVATYVHVDANGNLEESAPSPPINVTASSAAQLTATVRCLTLTNKQRLVDLTTTGPANPVFIRLYRQQKLGSGDPLFYQVLVTDQTKNDLLADTVTIVDTTTDAALSDGTHELLYTISGELLHNLPESFTHSIAHKNRLWGIGADQRTIWYSQAYSDGAVPAFSLAQIVTVDDCDEPLVALASLYDKLLILTRSRIYVVFGDGPSISGASNDLTPPQRIPGDAGCIDPRSVVPTRLGVFFQSQRGIELVTPGLTYSFAGMPIAVTTATYPICTSAVHDEVASTVRWSFVTAEQAPDSGALGVVVLYDLRRDRWAVHQLTAGGNRGNVAGAPVIAATQHPSLGYVAGWNDDVSDGVQAVIARENTAADPTPWLDLGVYFVPLQIVTAWIKSGDLQGWQVLRRVRILADSHASHGLQVVLDYDYAPILGGEVHAWTSAQIAALINGSQEQLRIIPATRRCEAIRVTMVTVAPTSPQVLGSGHGAGFTGLAFEVHRERGGARRYSAGARS